VVLDVDEVVVDAVGVVLLVIGGLGPLQAEVRTAAASVAAAAIARARLRVVICFSSMSLANACSGLAEGQ
jgi:hypothetical protein